MHNKLIHKSGEKSHSNLAKVFTPRLTRPQIKLQSPRAGAKTELG